MQALQPPNPSEVWKGAGPAAPKPQAVSATKPQAVSATTLIDMDHTCVTEVLAATGTLRQVATDSGKGGASG